MSAGSASVCWKTYIFHEPQILLSEERDNETVCLSPSIYSYAVGSKKGFVPVKREDWVQEQRKAGFRSLPNIHTLAVLGFVLFKFPRAHVAPHSYMWLERATVRAGDWTWAEMLAELGKDHKEPKEQLLTACKDCWRELLSDVHDSSVVQQGKTKQKADQHKEILVQGQVPWEVQIVAKKIPTFRNLHKSRTTLQSRNLN